MEEYNLSVNIALYKVWADNMTCDSNMPYVWHMPEVIAIDFWQTHVITQALCHVLKSRKYPEIIPWHVSKQNVDFGSGLKSVLGAKKSMFEQLNDLTVGRAQAVNYWQAYLANYGL